MGIQFDSEFSLPAFPQAILSLILVPQEVMVVVPVWVHVVPEKDRKKEFIEVRLGAVQSEPHKKEPLGGWEGMVH